MDKLAPDDPMHLEFIHKLIPEHVKVKPVGFNMTSDGQVWIVAGNAKKFHPRITGEYDYDAIAKYVTFWYENTWPKQEAKRRKGK